MDFPLLYTIYSDSLKLIPFKLILFGCCRRPQAAHIQKMICYLNLGFHLKQYMMLDLKFLSRKKKRMVFDFITFIAHFNHESCNREIHQSSRKAQPSTMRKCFNYQSLSVFQSCKRIAQSNPLISLSFSSM